MVAVGLHGIKITAEQGLCMLVPEISNITKATLHACASHHIDQKNTWQVPL